VHEDGELLARLRARDEGAFVVLVQRYHPAMIRLATTFVPSAAIAEEVVQETWVAVIRGIDRFEGRSSLRTWLFRILANRARTIGAKERRSVPVDTGEGTVDPRRFTSDGRWSEPPVAWPDDVDERLVATANAKRIRAAIAGLPDGQRQVVTLRDGEGLSAPEVCEILGLTEGNQRLLLHRGRSHVRRLVDDVVVE
jgi:RNA polymerase sigma-70 factor (ECF subfamily)